MAEISVGRLLTMAGMSMLPVIELKGAIPIGVAMGLPLAVAFTICLVFSTLPTPFIIWLFQPVMRWARNKPLPKRFFDWLAARSMKHAGQVEKWKYFGLFVFVAIPLPGTGIWTGSIIASLLDMELKKSTLMVALGNLVAGLLITLATYVFV